MAQVRTDLAGCRGGVDSSVREEVKARPQRPELQAEVRFFMAGKQPLGF